MMLSCKNLLLVALSCIPFLYGFSQDVTLTTQAEVDAFDSSMSTVNGNLTIETAILTIDPIVDLSNLSNLVAVSGNLSICTNFDLEDINGLINLTSIGGDFKIRGNAAITDLGSLANLVSIGGSFQVSQNNELLSLEDLSSLTSIDGGFLVANNL